MQSGSQKLPQTAAVELPAVLPTSHQPLAAEKVSDFSDWLEPQLQDLESHFRDYWTASSFKKSLSR